MKRVIAIESLLSKISVFLCLVFLSGTAVGQKIEIDIEGGAVRGIPTAIVPFKVINGPPLSQAMHEVVVDDLRASGKFDPIAPQNFLTLPSRAEEVRFKDWRLINVEALVIGEVLALDNGRYEVQFRIFDVARQTELGTGRRIPNLSSSDLRTAGHIISDHVYEAFTGRPGAFNSRIAFIDEVVQGSRPRYRLLVGDWDGFGAQEVYASWQPLLSPSWSPDGSRLAFVAFTDKGSIVRVLELATGKPTTVASFKGVNTAPSWSPDGAKLAYSSSRNGSPDVYVYDFDTEKHERISKHFAIDTEPSWSPDGRDLLFTSNRTGKPQIYRYNLSGGAINRVTFEGDENANASYDYNGERLVMVHLGGQIAVVQNESDQMVPITFAKFDESPSFSPNGDMVLYATEEQFEPLLKVASSDGRVKTTLKYVKGDVREPAWSPLRQ